MNPQQQGGVNLGSAYGQIVISDNIDAAMQNAGRAFDNALSTIGGRMDQIGQTMSNVGQQITIATAPLAIFGAQGVRAAMRYEDAMKEIEVRAGLTSEQLEMVAQKTEEIGIRSQYGPAQAADAFLQLLSSGSSVAEAMEQVDAVVDGAAASGQELGFVADALTDVMAAFGLEASESTAVMQSLIDATGSSSATLPDLIQGFSNVGPSARNAGLSVEETAAALAVFAENGIKGANGGTQLKTVLDTLQGDTAAEELERLGVSITDMEGNIRPLNDIIVDLNGAMDGMSEAERNRSIRELAGSYGMLGLSALLAEGGINDMMATMDEQAAIQDIANARMETFSGAIAFTMGSIELLQIRALRPFMQDTLRPLVLYVGDVVNKISEWVNANPELAQQIIRVLAVLTALGPTLVVVGQAVSFIGGGLSGLGTLFAVVGAAIGLVLSPIGLLIAGVIAAIGYFGDFGEILHRINIIFTSFKLNGLSDGFRVLFMTFEDGSSYLGGLLEAFGLTESMSRRIANTINQRVVPTFVAFRDFLAYFVSDLRNFGIQEAILSVFGRGITGEGQQSSLEGLLFRLGFSREHAIEIVQNTFHFLSSALANLTRTFQRVTAATVPAFREIGIFLNNHLGQIIDFAMQAFNIGRSLLALTNPIGQIGLLIRVFGFDLVSVFETVMGAVTRFFNALNGGKAPIDALRSAFNDNDFFNSVVNGFQQISDFITMTVVPSLQSIYDWFVNEGLPAAIDFVTQTAVPALMSFGAWLMGIWTMAQPHLEALGNWFINDVMPQITGILQSVILLAFSVATWFGNMWTIAQPHLEALAQWFLTDGLSAIMTYISDTALPGIQSIIDIFTRIWTDVSPFLLQLFDWFMNEGLPVITDFITNDVLPVIDNLINTASNIWTAVSPYLEQFYNWFISNGLPAIMDFIENDFTNVVDAAISLITDFLDQINDATTLVNNFAQGNPLGQGMNGGNQFVQSAASIVSSARQGDVSGTVSNTFDIIPGLGGATRMIKNVLGFANGVNVLPQDMLIQAHAGEAIIPANQNPFNPNASQPFGGGGPQFNVQIANITANNAEEGRQAGDAFGDAFLEKMRTSGFTG